MATLHRYTGDPAFLTAARDAATYLEAIARTDAGVFLVPYGWPNAEWEGLYEAGWAHGAAGTARFFHRGEVVVVRKRLVVRRTPVVR